ncbi:MAG: hypothetical protein HQK99_08455 [Nitrospirae bacterium]|nr:hypothetical protein [Nitrospirota bacterium]
MDTMDKDMYGDADEVGGNGGNGHKAVAVLQDDIKIAPARPAAHGDTKVNCWEFNKCGREPGGDKVEELGVCPVTIATSFNGLHGGTNAGRACWAVPFACGDAEGKMSFASKIRKCTQCEFHHLVIKEEDKYQSALKHLKKFNKEEKEKLFKEKIFKSKGNGAFKEPGLVRHIFEKSMHTAYGEDAEVDSLFITLLIGWVSLCPSVSFLEGSKRICKDDLVDELMIIDAISDRPRRRAARTVAKTMLHAVGKQITRYFDPLVDIVKEKTNKS